MTKRNSRRNKIIKTFPAAPSPKKKKKKKGDLQFLKLSKNEQKKCNAYNSGMLKLHKKFRQPQSTKKIKK